MAIILPHQFKDGVNETASGVQVMDNFNAVTAELEKTVRDATHETLKIQTGVFSVPGFGGGAFSFEVTLPHSWSTIHLVFLAGNAVSPTENKSWLTGSEAIGLFKGKIKGPGGPNFEAANVPWISIGV